LAAFVLTDLKKLKFLTSNGGKEHKIKVKRKPFFMKIIIQALKMISFSELIKFKKALIENKLFFEIFRETIKFKLVHIDQVTRQE